MGAQRSSALRLSEKSRLQYTVFKPKRRSSSKKPSIREMALMIRLKVPGDQLELSCPKIMDMPLTPPKEKWLGNLKK